MQANQVDGIKKLSKEEIQRSRDIVLDTIGEKPAKQPVKSNDYLINSSNIAKKMDGISEPAKPGLPAGGNSEPRPAETAAFDIRPKESILSIINEPKKTNTVPEKTRIAATPKPQPIIPKAVLEKIAPLIKKPGIFSRLSKYLRKKSEDRKIAKTKELELKKNKHAQKEQQAKQAALDKQKKIELARQEQAIKAAALEKQKINEQAKIKKQKVEKITAKETRKSQTPIINLNNPSKEETGDLKEIISITGYEMLKKEGVDFVADLKSENIRKEKKSLAKPSKEEIANRRAEEKIIKQAEVERKRAEKSRLKELRKEIAKNFFKSLNRRIVLISKRSIFVTTITFVGCISVYFLILISIVRFDIDNKITRRVADSIPIPAYISTDGIMEYFKYKDMKDELLAGAGDYTNIENDIKKAVVKRLVLEELARKYSLLFNAKQNLFSQIATQLAFDMEVNIVPVNRIKKIKQLIDKQGDFVRVATKYGDELGQVTTDYSNSQNLYYFDDIKDLELGQVSDTVLTPNGYYIFKCFDKDSASIALSYVFIKSNTLDDYINEEVKGYKLISFVD